MPSNKKNVCWAPQCKLPAEPAWRGSAGGCGEPAVGVPPLQGHLRAGLRVLLQLRALPQEGGWLGGWLVTLGHLIFAG
eukprot:1161058-Pelagomonas_calceolata.AAC.6